MRTFRYIEADPWLRLKVVPVSDIFCVSLYLSLRKMNFQELSHLYLLPIILPVNRSYSVFARGIADSMFRIIQCSFLVVNTLIPIRLPSSVSVASGANPYRWVPLAISHSTLTLELCWSPHFCATFLGIVNCSSKREILQVPKVLHLLTRTGPEFKQL